MAPTSPTVGRRGAAGRVRDVGVPGLARSPAAGARRQGRPAGCLRRVVQRGRGQHDVLRAAVGDDGGVVGRPGAGRLPVPLQAAAHRSPTSAGCATPTPRCGSSSSCSRPLGSRAEQLSVQLPASFGPPDLGALATFVRRLPSLGAEGHRIAVEVRHPAFFDGSVARSTLARVLADVGGEWIVLDSTTLFAAPPTIRRRARDLGSQAPTAGASQGGVGPSGRALHRP